MVNYLLKKALGVAVKQVAVVALEAAANRADRAGNSKLATAITGAAFVVSPMRMLFESTSYDSDRSRDASPQAGTTATADGPHVCPDCRDQFLSEAGMHRHQVSKHRSRG